MQKFLSVRILCFKKIVADIRNLKHDRHNFSWTLYQIRTAELSWSFFSGDFNFSEQLLFVALGEKGGQICAVTYI